MLPKVFRHYLCAYRDNKHNGTNKFTSLDQKNLACAWPVANPPKLSAG
jgi:hypothetical protein